LAEDQARRSRSAADPLRHDAALLGLDHERSEARDVLRGSEVIILEKRPAPPCALVECSLKLGDRTGAVAAERQQTRGEMRDVGVSGSEAGLRSLNEPQGIGVAALVVEGQQRREHFVVRERVRCRHHEKACHGGMRNN
jgi:hypothetical protein